MKDEVLKVMVVEDDAVIAQLIKQDLTDAGHNVMAVFHKRDNALDYLKDHSPTFALLDINLGSGNEGIKIGGIINEKYKIPFIYLTAHSDPNTLQIAKKTQPCGYILKPYRSNDLISAITIGQFNFSKRRSEQDLCKSQIDKLSAAPITDREFEIILDITKGLTNSQIAERHFLTLNTIKWHIQNIYSKLQVKNRTSLVKVVLEF